MESGFPAAIFLNYTFRAIRARCCRAHESSAAPGQRKARSPCERAIILRRILLMRSGRLSRTGCNTWHSFRLCWRFFKRTSNTKRKENEKNNVNTNHASGSSLSLWWTGTAQVGREAAPTATGWRSTASGSRGWREPHRLENPSGLDERVQAGDVSLYSWHRDGRSGRRRWPRCDNLRDRAGRLWTDRRRSLRRVSHGIGRGARAQAADPEFC